MIQPPWQLLPIASRLPMSVWGKDHFSTLAYLETSAVDHGGRLNNEHMRCAVQIHPLVAHRTRDDGRRYPTILRDGSEQPDHDDWSCLEDFVTAGLIVAYYRDGEGRREVNVSFTPAGIRLAHSLRAWKMLGGTYATFRPEEAPE